MSNIEANMIVTDQLLLLSQKVQKLRATSSASPEHVERFRARLKEVGELLPSSKEAFLAALSDEEDLITLESHHGEPAKRVFYDDLGRIFLGIAILIAALTLQVVSSLSIKLLVGVQMVGVVVALCLPLRNALPEHRASNKHTRRYERGGSNPGL